MFHVVLRLLISLCFFPGPPGEPEIKFTNDNQTVCCMAYANSNYPVEYFRINTTTLFDNNHSVHYSFEVSKCFRVSSEIYPHVCTKLVIELVAVNILGESNQRKYVIQGKLSSKVH